MKVIPPPLATWLLKHLVLADSNEALEGDLLEEFQQRRSASWYWRQVLGAILSFSNVLRAGWVTIWAVVFAEVWLYGLRLILHYTAHAPWQIAFGHWLMHEPYGMPIWIAMGVVFYVAGPLSLYLALTRNLSLRAFTIGLGSGTAVFVMVVLPFSHPFFESHLANPLNYLLEYGRAQHWNVRLWLDGYELLQWSLPLLAAMWAAALSKTKTGTSINCPPGSPES